MTPAEVLKFAEKTRREDGRLQVRRPARHLAAHHDADRASSRTTRFKDGFFFDGSSIRGWQPINASDMIFIPDADSAIMDPFLSRCRRCRSSATSSTPSPSSPTRGIPRTIAAKAEAYLKSTGIGDTSYFGPEPEFFIFDEVRYSEGPNRSSYLVDSIEGRWNTRPRRGPEPRLQAGPEGRLLPRSADRHADRPARRDGA